MGHLWTNHFPRPQLLHLKMSGRAHLTVAVRTKDSKQVKHLGEDWPRVSISGHHHPLRWWEKWDSVQGACPLRHSTNKHEEGEEKQQMPPVCSPCGSFSKDASCHFCSRIFRQTLRPGAMYPNSAHRRPIFLSCFTAASCHVCFPHLVCITWVYESGFTQTLGSRETFLELWAQQIHNKHFLQGGCGVEWGAKWKKGKKRKTQLRY